MSSYWRQFFLWWLALEQGIIENQTVYIKSNDDTGNNEDNLDQNKTYVADEEKDPDYTQKPANEEQKDSENKGKIDDELKKIITFKLNWTVWIMKNWKRINPT